MAILEQKIKNIIQKYALFVEKPYSRNEASNFPFPYMLGTGRGYSIEISKEIYELIVDFTDKLLSDDKSLSKRFKRDEGISASQRCFGKIFDNIGEIDNLDDFSSSAHDEIKEEMHRYLDEREFHFGCTLFQSEDVKSISLGPVIIESRENWLSRQQSAGSISSVACERIKEVWSTGAELDARESSQDYSNERNIIHGIGSCPFVCSVKIPGLAPEAGKERALTAARLALTAISLFWNTPSHALNGMNLYFDGPTYSQTTLVCFADNIMTSGVRSSHRPVGPYVMKGKWDEYMQQHAAEFGIIDNILQYFVSAAGESERPNIMHALAQAMLWFHEGCRETTALMAIVKFSATLDGLAHGRESNGMKDLITARLGIERNAPIWEGGPTMENIVGTIYSDGRSRTVHGTNPKINDDWTEVRNIAEQFAKLTLWACINWAAENPTSDDPRQFTIPPASP